MTAGPAASRENLGMYNCSALTVDSVRAFDEIMYILMNGTGVGYSVEQQFVNKLPEVAETFHVTDSVIVVGDSKKGWASAYRELIALLYAGKIPSWDVSKVRPEGSPLKVFGGRASGPDSLVKLFQYTIRTFKKAAGRKLTSLECSDIICNIASVIVSGGVRRSALICLSDLSDFKIRDSKSGMWWETEVERGLANVSAVYESKPDLSVFIDEWKALMLSGSGERGIFNRDAIKRSSPERRKTEGVTFVTNPCFSGDQRFLTEHGWRRFDEMEGQSVNILQDSYFSASLIDGVEYWHETGQLGVHVVNSPMVAVTGYDKNIYKLTTLSGRVIKTTDNHKFATTDGFVELKKLVTLSSATSGNYPHKLVYPDFTKLLVNNEANDYDNEYAEGELAAKSFQIIDDISYVHYKSVGFKKGFLSQIDENVTSVDLMLLRNETGDCDQRGDLCVDYVVSVEFDHVAEKVYCLKEDVNRTVIVQGLTVARCGEISLRPQGLCNLTEAVIRSTDTINQIKNKIRIASIIGTIQSSFTDFDYVRNVWKKNAEEERLLGVSMTGIVARQWTADELQLLKQIAIDTNLDTAAVLRINESVAVTTCKPSGTVSELVDCSSGIHPAYAQFYVRTVRNSVNDPMSKALIDAGVPYELDVTNSKSYVFSFPKSNLATNRHQINAIDQLELYKLFKLNWAEHNVSNTVYVGADEWLTVGAWVYQNFDIIGGVSFLPRMDDDHSYRQAPFQEISEAEYLSMVETFPVFVDWNAVLESSDETTGGQELACVAGACELK